MEKFRKIIKKWWRVVITTTTFLTPLAVVAQVEVGNSIASDFGLMSGNLKVTIVAVIRVLLGLIGLAAVVLVMYGGYKYMTSQGEAEKVKSAKRLIQSALVGLAIVILSFAITQFVYNFVSESAGGVDDSNPNACQGATYCCAGVPSEVACTVFNRQVSFTVAKIIPNNQTTIRNATVKIRLTLPVDPSSIGQEAVEVTNVSSGDAVVAGSLSVDQNDPKLVVFSAVGECGSAGGNDCFPANSSIAVKINPNTLRSTVASGGQLLQCPGSTCQASFTVNDVVDRTAPTARITDPASTVNIVQNSQRTIIASASDDSGIAYLGFSLDNTNSWDIYDDPVRLISGDEKAGQFAWTLDTNGLTFGYHTIKLLVKDLNSNQVIVTRQIKVVPESCGNNTKDGDETGVDCGGSCGGCAGESCNDPATLPGSCVPTGSCSSSTYCDGASCLCALRPVITDIAPSDGAPGTYVTILGSGFGASPGIVTFLGGPGSSDDRNGIAPSGCVSYWSDSQIVIEAPQPIAGGIITGPIQVITAMNVSDSTDDTFGPILSFTQNDINRPGICGVTPSSGLPNETAVTITGRNLGDSPSGNEVTFGGETPNQTLTDSQWNPEAIADVTVPNLKPKTVTVKVKVAGLDSNGYSFTVADRNETTVPFIESIDPVEGPVSTYVTIRGFNFGGVMEDRTVKFVNETNLAYEGDFTFPDLCTSSIWSDNQILVKVPSVLKNKDGVYQVKIYDTKGTSAVGDDEAISGGQPFTVNSNPDTPGLCLATPTVVDPAKGTELTLVGDNFGANGSVMFTGVADVTPKSYEKQQTVAVTPVGAKTGLVKVKRQKDGAISNGLAVQVVGDTDVDPTLVKDYYQWSVTTGHEPTNISVVEDSSCLDSPASPSPYKNKQDVCLNSEVGLRFDLTLDPASVDVKTIAKATADSEATFRIWECNTSSQKFDGNGCEELVVTGKTISTINNSSYLTFAGLMLQPSRWYKVLVSADIKSTTGLPLVQDYIWKFSTSPIPCMTEKVSLYPEIGDRITVGTQQVYTASAHGPDCQAIVPTGVWYWSSPQESEYAHYNPEYVPQTPVLGMESQIVADKETPVNPRQPVTVAVQLTESVIDLQAVKTATKELEITRRPFALVDEPLCGEGKQQSPSPYYDVGSGTADGKACVNALLRFIFTKNVDSEQGSNIGNYRLYELAEPDPIAIELDETIVTQNVVTISAKDNLKPSTRYRWEIVGGPDGVVSQWGEELVSPMLQGEFVTRADANLCAVGSIEVSPAKSKLGYKRSKQFLAQPIAANCNVLNDDGYVWNWSALPSDDVLVEDTAKSLVNVTGNGPSDTAVRLNAKVKIDGKTQKNIVGSSQLTLYRPEIISLS
ncbi:MAG: IPT/TIG domain-containing protein, partial [bacterium]